MSEQRHDYAIAPALRPYHARAHGNGRRQPQKDARLVKS